METNQLLEKVGSILNLSDDKLKEFKKQAKVVEVADGVYEVQYKDNGYMVFENEEKLSSYATKQLLEDTGFIPNADFLLNYIEIDKIALREHILERLDDISMHIEDDIELGYFYECAEELGAEVLYQQYENKELTEEELQEGLREVLEYYLDEKKESLEKEITKAPLDYLKKTYGYTKEFIAKELWKRGNCFFLSLSKTHEEIAKEIQKLYGVSNILKHLTCISSNDEVKVYRWN
jgi:hypothetical protein